MNFYKSYRAFPALSAPHSWHVATSHKAVRWSWAGDRLLATICIASTVRL